MRGSRPHNPSQEYQIIDGIYFYKERKGIGYFLGSIGEPGKKMPIRAHVYVWERHNGKIPKGYHVHHIDENPANNDISNLVLLSDSEHTSMHVSKHSDESKKRMEEIVRPKAIEWHKSEDGSEWHKSHYEKIAQKIWSERVKLNCVICGKEFETNHASMKKAKYCSQNCKSKARRKSGADNETRVCAICGKEFTCNKYSRAKLCSKECCNESQRRLKTGVPRHRRSNP